MKNINYGLDIDDEYIYIRVPKRKAKYMSNPKLDFINISKRIIEKFIWGKEEIVPHGEPVHLDAVLRELDNERIEFYTKIKEKYLGRKFFVEGYEGNGRMANGYITDISLEDGWVDDSRGNIAAYTDLGTMSSDLPLEAKYRHEIESEIALGGQRWEENNYKDIYGKRDEDILKSINLDASSVKSECDLERYLKTRLYLIEDGLRLLGTQVEVKGGIIDILARDKEDRLVIIELKVSQKARELIWQCMYYPLRFKDEEGLRMITIAPAYDESIKVILDEIPYVEQMTYRIENNKLNIN